MIRRWLKGIARLWQENRGSVFVEYILLLTIVGIGVIVGLAVLKDALINELHDLALAIEAIAPCP